MKENDLINLLLELSKFEFLMKSLLTQIFKKKSKMWQSDKDKCCYYMEEVAEFFAGNRNWGGEHTDQDLSDYFKRIVQTISEFEYRHTTKVGRKIQKLMIALEDLQLQHNIFDGNVQIAHNITQTRNKLHHMIQIMGIKKNVIQQMNEICGFSYAWIAMGRYLNMLQKTIGSNPKSVLMLKTVFIKMSTIMESPLSRIAEAHSEDFESVAAYYSRELVKFIKSVLYVIPVNIFKELDLVSQIMSTQVKEFKVKINKDVLKEQTLFEQRFTLAKKTHEITLLT